MFISPEFIFAQMRQMADEAARQFNNPFEEIIDVEFRVVEKTEEPQESLPEETSQNSETQQQEEESQNPN